jgi:streptogramin lyase
MTRRLRVRKPARIQVSLLAAIMVVSIPLAAVIQSASVALAALPCPSCTEFPIPTPNSSPREIVTGPDGNLWFAEFGGNGQIGRVTPSGTISEFPIPTLGAKPIPIAAGPDGNVWFGEVLADKIGRITPAGAITDFAIPTAGSHPVGVTAGPDGNIWFTEDTGNNIGRITTNGVITEFPVPTPNSGLGGIVTGPDGTIWFTESGAPGLPGSGNNIGRITTSGVIAEFPVPTPNSGPTGIATGPDGNLWFTEFDGNKIGRITPAGAITEFVVPTASSGLDFLNGGPDGNIWFTERTANNVGRITPTGAITEFAVPTANGAPFGITAGPDGSIWFTEEGGNKIGRITSGGGPPPVTDCASGTSPGGIHVEWPQPVHSDSTPWYALPMGAARQEVSLQLQFSDSVSEAVAGYLAMVDWGDGTGADAATVGRATNGTCLVTANHTYLNAGHYSVFVFLKSPDGRSVANTAVGVEAIAPSRFLASLPMIGVITGDPLPAQDPPAQCTATIVSSAAVNGRVNGDVVVTAKHCGLSRNVAFAPGHTGISPRITTDYRGDYSIGASGGPVSGVRPGSPYGGQTIGTSPYGVWRSTMAPIMDPNSDIEFFVMNIAPPGLPPGETLEQQVGGLPLMQPSLSPGGRFDIVGYDVTWIDGPWNCCGNATHGAPDQNPILQAPPGFEFSFYPVGDAGPHVCAGAHAFDSGVVAGHAAVNDCRLDSFASGAPWLDLNHTVIYAIEHRFAAPDFGGVDTCCVALGTPVGDVDMRNLKHAEHLHV